jgi:mono/diheme cytochrome c family protein
MIESDPRALCAPDLALANPPRDRGTPRMNRFVSLLTAPALALVATVASARADESAFERDARPVLRRHCVGCHSTAKPKGGIDLARFKDKASLRKEPDLWQRVTDALSEHTMPPKEKRQPSDFERQKAIDAIEASLASLDDVRDPGRTLIQRLTRRQYNNTIRDLLGVDSDPADGFPSDGGGGEGFDNNASTLFVPPLLMEKYLAAAGTVLDQADPARWLTARPGPGLTEDAAARRTIEAFATRAFRRPVESLEVERFFGLFRLASGRGEPFEKAVKLALRAILVSPNFLFLVEADQNSATPYRVGEYELASRLSYFVWSTMPDAELFGLAAKGTLHDPKTLDRQVKRMLADPRARALAEDFAGQWLRAASLAHAAEPDRGRFPTFNPVLRTAMIEEVTVFFQQMLKNDAPVLDLVGAKYSYINETLARHYGVDDVKGAEFRRLDWKTPDRGGVLGMAAILTLTSYPQRTSPVLRGKWVLEDLLGTPPPPPPPNVAVLPPDDRPKDGMTFRQRLEKHRSKAECAACHANLDPLGFGLESFDAIGRLRTEIAGTPVDASGTLTTGENFRGPAELKQLLLQKKKDVFVRNLTRRMLSYALRRGLEYYDKSTVTQMMGALEAKGYRSTVLVTEIVKSYPFQYRRNEPVAGSKP